MSEDNNDGGELLMHVGQSPMQEPRKPSMLHFQHMEWGKEKNKTMFLSNMFFQYMLEKWQHKVVEIDMKLKETVKTHNGKKNQNIDAHVVINCGEPK